MKCPLCSESGCHIEDPMLNVYVCPFCTHRFTVLKDGVQVDYDEEYFRKEHAHWFEHPDYNFFRSVYQKIRSLHGQGPLRLLDVGCGTGDFLNYVRQMDRKAELVGIDLIENQSEGIEFIKGDIYQTNISGSFDVLVCLHTIEHVPEPHQFVKIMDGLLRPGGLLFIGTIDSSSPIHTTARLLRLLSWRTAYDRIFSLHHLHHYSFRSLRALLELHDYAVIEHFNYNHPLQSVDVPNKGIISECCYKLATAILFFASRIFGKGMLQGILCRKPMSASS